MTLAPGDQKESYVVGNLNIFMREDEEKLREFLALIFSVT